MNLLFVQAYDQHLNMIMGDVEETVTTVEIDEETYEEIYKVGIETFDCETIANHIVQLVVAMLSDLHLSFSSYI